jgi:hypothetical protein
LDVVTGNIQAIPIVYPSSFPEKAIKRLMIMLP